MKSREKIFFSLASFVVMIATNAYAGKVEVTTYYPAPLGEYSELQANKTLKVPVVSASGADAKTEANTNLGEIWVETP